MSKRRISPTTVSAASEQTHDEGRLSSPDRWSALVLGLMIFLAPAMGVPSEEMLQDTLKSAVVTLMTIATALAFFWLHRRKGARLVWHGLMWLPLILAVYSLVSMTWSHSYLGGVEAVRWLVFSLIVWLGINISLKNFENCVIWGIHWGVTVASIWTALQFWMDFNLFPQGPNPASTFVNRNFFAEYAICALPYSIYLLMRCRGSLLPYGLAANIGFNLVALMMTGTRSALIALMVLFMLTPGIYGMFKHSIGGYKLSRMRSFGIASILLGTILSLGSIANHNQKLTAEFGPQNAISRAMGRTASMVDPEEYTTGSFSIRSVMWAATERMIAANLVTGVGAGAWEVLIPVYQLAGTQLETDFYAHNEFLQLLAEYGITGWLFIGTLLGYLFNVAWQTLTIRSGIAEKVAPLRVAALSSLLMLLIVSNAGFPWRMASTGALFALSLSLLAGCDARVGMRGWFLARSWTSSAGTVLLALISSAVCMMLALYVTQRAAIAERALIRGIKMALTITKSGDPRNQYWNQPKEEMLTSIRHGISLNRHYRKLTPMAADELASWGDWKNALWIWESVLESRPNVVAIIANIARAHLEMGNTELAQAYLKRAEELQPTAPAVKLLSVLILSRTGQLQLAGKQIKALFSDDIVDYESVYLGYMVGARTQDWQLMIQALELRIKRWPTEAVDGWLKLGNIYENKPGVQDDAKALSAYRSAIAATPDARRTETLSKIPQAYRNRL